jgi:dTDP-4-dehydrorhamnose reductase
LQHLKKTLVIGASGQIGGQLIKHAPNWANLISLKSSQLDLTHHAAIRECIQSLQPQYLINAAAYTMVDKAEAESNLAFAINADAVKILAEECAKIDCKIVHYSTDYVFDGTAHTAYVPSAAKNPLSVYGASKSAGEDYVVNTLSPNQFLILRTAWVYAPSANNFVTTMLRLLQAQPHIRIVSDQIGTPSSAENIAKATWLALEKNVCGTHHITDSGIASWYDFACQIARLAKQFGVLQNLPTISPIKTSEYPQIAKRPQFSVLDKSSFWAAASITPEHWCDSLERCWFRNVP